MPSTTDEDLDDQKADTAGEDTATSDGDTTEGLSDDAASDPDTAGAGENDGAEPATPGRRRRRVLVWRFWSGGPG